MPPFAVTSVRKFVAVTVCPDWPFTWPMSDAVTEPFPVVSPTSTPMEAETLPLRFPSESVTLLSATFSTCAFATPRWITWQRLVR